MSEEKDQEELAFEQGHAEVRGDPIPQPEVKEEPAAEQVQEQPAPEGLPEGKTETTEQATPPTLEERMAAIESNFPSIKQGLDSLAGRLGGINRDLQGLKTIRQAQPPGSPAAVAAEKLVAEKLKRLNADYPEVAAALADDLNEILSAPRQGAAPQIDVEAIRRDAEDAAIARVERRLLQKEHPNWEVDIALKDELGRPLRDGSGRYLPSPVFQEWLNQKPEQFRNAFIGAVDSDFLSSGLKDFKEYRAKRTGQAPAAPVQSPAPAPAAAAPTSNKQQRLAAAITPQGKAPVAGPSALSEDDAFVSGFKSVRG